MKSKFFRLIPFFAIAFVALFLSGCMGAHTHEISEWHTKTPATCTSPEVLIRECKSCDFSETKQGESAKGHKYSSAVTQPTETQNGYTTFTCGACGDFYKSNYKSLIVFENVAKTASISTSELPTYNQAVVSTGTQFNGVTNTNKFKPISYKFETTSGVVTMNVGDNIQTSGKIIITWDYITPPAPSAEEVAFNNLVQKLEKLEQLSIAYNTANSSTANPQLRVMQYIRNGRYSDTTWNLVGGTIEADFANYVKANQGGIDVESLQSISDITIPKTGEKVDFVHMFATINTLAKGAGMMWSAQQAGDLGGWGGDLCQLAQDVKNSSLSQTVQQKVDSLFMASSGFGSADMYADMDAVNIFSAYTAMSTKSISSAFKTYYLSVTTSLRISTFKTNCFVNENTSSTDALAADIITRLSSNTLIKTWCTKNNLDFTQDAEIFTACAKRFAKYVIEQKWIILCKIKRQNVKYNLPFLMRDFLVFIYNYLIMSHI